MGSVLRRSGTKLARIISRALAPLGSTTESRIWALSSQLMVTDNTPIIRQITGPWANVPRGYIEGFAISKQTIAIIAITAGIARDSTDVLSISSDVALSVNHSVSGAGGIDAGAVAINTWYYFFVIADTTGLLPVSTLMSLSSTAPTIPAGYDVFRRIGAMRTAAASTNWVDFQQRQITDRTRRIYWDVETAQIVNAGNATVFTDADFSTQAPVTCRNLVLETRFLFGTAGAVGDVLSLRPDGATAADGPFQTRRGAPTGNQSMISQLEMPCSAAQVIEYMVTQGGVNLNTASIRCLAFDDEL